MATITPRSSPPSTQSRVDSGDRITRSSSTLERSCSADELIAARIAEAQAALWRAELVQSILALVVTGLVVVTAWAMLEQWLWAPGQWVRCIVWLAGVGATIAWMRYRIWPLFSKQVLPEYAAYSLEHDAPSLRHALTSYVTLRDDQTQAGVRGLVVRSIGARAAGQIRQLQLEAPSEAAIRMTWWLALAGAIAFAAAYLALCPRNALQSTTRLLMPLASIDAPHRVTIEDVLPGDTETLASLPFTVSAKIDGLRQSETASVQWGANFSQQQPLALDAATGRHQANVQVDASTGYRIVAGDAVAGPYSISAKSLPVATIEQIEVIPPSYTELPQRTTRGGPIVAEANSTIKLTGTSTLPLRKARIEFNPVEVGDRVQASGGTLDMAISPDRKKFSVEFVLSDRDALSASNRTTYRVHVWDESDHDNPNPIVYPIRVIEDLLPEISIASPKQTEVEVAINGSLPIEIHATDPDYRLKQIDVQIKRSIDVIWSEPAWSSAQGERGHHSLIWMFEPALVQASVGDRFELMAAAMDNHHDAEGQLAPHRTTSSPLIIKIVKADPAGRVGSLGKPEEQGDKQGKSSGQKNDGDQASGSGEGQPSGQSASGGSGEEAKSEEQGDGEGGSRGETSKKPGKESGSGEGSSDDQGPGDQDSAQSGNGGKPNQEQPPTAPENADPSNSESGDQQGESADSSLTVEPNAPSDKANGAPSGSDPSTAADRSQKPSHDGEAFERIRDFIKNQPPNSKASPSSSAESKPQGNHSSSKEDGPQNKDTTSKPADAATTGSQTGEQGASSPKMKEGQQGAGQDQAPNDPLGPNADPAKGENQEAAASETDKGKADHAEAGDGKDAPPDEAGEPGAGKPTPADSKASKPKQGDAQSPTNGDTQPAGESGEGTDEMGGKSDENSQNADSDQKNGQPTEGENANGKPKDPSLANQDRPKGDSPKPSNSGATNGVPSRSNSAQPNAKEGSSQTQSPDGPQGQNQNSAISDRNDQASGGAGESSDETRPPDPVNADYAREATDLVLQYLNSHRESIPPELLERLDWTPEELRDFADRWSRLRNQEATGGADRKMIDETLRSLGLRKLTDQSIGRRGERADNLGGLKDAGNRNEAPAVHRDAFDAFRRHFNRQ